MEKVLQFKRSTPATLGSNEPHCQSNPAIKTWITPPLSPPKTWIAGGLKKK